MRLHCALVGICLVLNAPPARALEVDCAACDFCIGRGDLADALDVRIRSHLAAGRTVMQIAAAEGGGPPLRPRIQAWAEARPEAVSPNRSRGKYRGSGLPDNFLLSAYAASVRVNGICIGTDKLGHLFQDGWEYYRIAVIEGKGEAVATRYGEWQEGLLARESYARDEAYFLSQPLGHIGYGRYGRCLSGVISQADLAANRAGLQLYQDLAAGKFNSIRDYVTKDLCEETNPNDYTPTMKRVVEYNSRTNAGPTTPAFRPIP